MYGWWEGAGAGVEIGVTPVLGGGGILLSGSNDTRG